MRGGPPQGVRRVETRPPTYYLRRMKRLILLAPFVLAACDVVNDLAVRPKPQSAPGSIEEAAPPPPPPPPSNARTVEDFDTTSAADREAAAAPSTDGALLGTTVASLGDAATPGFWIETPLVDEVMQGRIRYPETGRSVGVELRPSEGGSSRVSLAALRLLGAPLTELVTLEVYKS